MSSSDDLERRGSETVDLVADFATPLPLSVISTMLGVGDEDRDEFHVLMERFVVRLGSGSAGRRAAGRSRRPASCTPCWSGWPSSAVPLPTTG